MAKASRDGSGSDPSSEGSASTRRMPAAERRDSILRAARKVFMEKGLDGARTRDIAAEAGINEAMMYRHFSSKDDLFEVAVSAPLEEAVGQLVGASGQPPDEFDASGTGMRERTKAFMVDLTRVMDEISEMLGVALFRESAAASDYFRDRIAPNLATIESVVEANLAHWNHNQFEIRMAVNIAFGSTWFYVTTSKLSGQPIEAEKFADQMVDVLFDGLIREESAASK